MKIEITPPKTGFSSSSVAKIELEKRVQVACQNRFNHTTLFHKISCTKVVRVGVGWGVFPDMSGIRKILVDFSGIVGFGLRNREVFWNKSCSISAELGRIHVRNSVKNQFFLRAAFGGTNLSHATSFKWSNTIWKTRVAGGILLIRLKYSVHWPQGSSSLLVWLIIAFQSVTFWNPSVLE